MEPLASWMEELDLCGPGGETMAWTAKLSPGQGCSTVVGLQNSPLMWGAMLRLDAPEL